MTVEEQYLPLGEFVLVKQVLKLKDSRIIRPEKSDPKDKFDFSSEIVALGRDCKLDIKVGDHPIFSEYAKLNPIHQIYHNPNKGMIHLVMVHENDIIGIDKGAKTLDLGIDENLN